MNYDMSILDEIMKPYFEKREQINNSKSNINVLKLKLKKLIQNKDKEIESYIKEAMTTNPNFYSGYGAMIRKDLYQAYKLKENEIKKEIECLESLNNSYELDEIRISLRDKLFDIQKNLNFELKQEQAKYDLIVMDLTNFKYEYNEQSQVINGSAWRNLYEKSIEFSNKIKTLNEILEKLKDYLSLIEEKSEEEIKISKTNNLQQFEFIDSEVLFNSENSSKKEGISDYANLLNIVYNDIISEIQKINGIKIKSKQNRLPENVLNFSNQLCLNLEDIQKALENLSIKEKGNVYTISKFDNQQEIQLYLIKSFEKYLKIYTTIKLLKEGKITKIDLIRTCGKQRTEEIIKEIENFQTKNNIQLETYILKEEMIYKLSQCFATKSADWIDKLSSNGKTL